VLGGLWTKTRTPIGLDLGSACIRMVQLQQRADGLAATAVASRPLPEQAAIGSDAYHQAVGQAVSDILAGGGFTGRRIVSCLPVAVMHYKNLRLPKMPMTDMAQAVYWDAQERLRSIGQKLATQFVDAGEVRQGDEVRHEIILMAAPEEFIDKHLKSLVKAGLQVDAIECAPPAITRAIHHDHNEDKSGLHCLSIDVGYSHTQIMITKADHVQFFKSIEVGCEHMDRAIAHQLHVTLAEAAELREQLCATPASAQPSQESNASEQAAQAMAGVAEMRQQAQLAMRSTLNDLGREVALCLRYYGVTFRGVRPSKALLFGGVSHLQPLIDILDHEAGLHCEPADPFEQIDVRAVHQNLSDPRWRGAWACAVGAARWGLPVATSGRVAA